MDQKNTKIRDRLVRMLDKDEIYTAYAKSAQALEADFEAIAAALPPDQRKVLVGYSECLKLMGLRAMTIAAEQMDFKK